MIFVLSFTYPNSVDVLVQSSLNIVGQTLFRSDLIFTYRTNLDISLMYDVYMLFEIGNNFFLYF